MKFYEERYRAAISKSDSINNVIDNLSRVKNDIQINKLEIMNGYKAEESEFLIRAYKKLEKDLCNQIENLSKLQIEIKIQAKKIRDDEYRQYRLSLINLKS